MTVESRTMRRSTLGSSLVVLALVASSPAHADEPDKARCAAAYERAQELQRSEALSAAKKQLVICRDTCPGRLRRDCVSWIDDVDALMPTIVLRPHGARNEPIKDVRVTIDGELLVETITPTTPLSVDPGEHVLRFEHPDLVPAEVRITLHGGERGREVALTLWRQIAPPQSPPPDPVVRPAAPPPRGHRPAAYAFGIGGLAGLALGGGLALAGHLKRSDLAGTCAPLCSHGDVDTVLALWWTGAGLAALGAISLGIGTYLWVTPRSDANAMEKRGVWLGPTGAFGRF